MTLDAKKNTGVRYVLLSHVLIVLFSVAGYSQDIGPSAEARVSDSEFRVETLPVAGGAELLTIFARRSAFCEADTSTGEVPLVSVLRDTLGDDVPENDKLRFIWMLSYTRPTFWQKAAAVVPFLYTRTKNKDKIGKSPPPAIADMQGSDSAMWNGILWMVFKRIVLSAGGPAARSTAVQYRQNADDYRRSAIAGALAVLSVYEKAGGERVLSDQELRDIQARLWLTDKPLGGMVQDENLDRVYEKKVAAIQDNRGHNWELLRQYTEAQGLYFEPIQMGDGAQTHALVWTTVEDLSANEGRKFDGRFLNIQNPWGDKDLRNWKGYKASRWFDESGGVVDSDTPGAVERTMIPLALYGLDTAKIPGILIDFRNTHNPKRREMSRRVINDITGNVLAMSAFSSVPYLLGRSAFDFVTGRRGTDMNQESRLRSYRQLKMLLSLDSSLDAGLRNDLAKRIETVSLNPLENDIEAEIKIAQTQYRNLVAYASRPDGLPAKIERDRREEMVRYAHSGKKQAWFNALHSLTFGLYTHREKDTPESQAKLDVARQLQFHERVLNEIAGRSVQPEVDSDMLQLRSSLLFVSENGGDAKGKTAKSLSKIFSRTDDEDLRRLCLTALYRIDNSAAKTELLAIYHNMSVDPQLRDLSAGFLKRSVAEGKRISSRTAAGVAALAVN
jgi:hypothetical protein